MRANSLKLLTEVQEKVIGQLRSLLETQTKPICAVHPHCRINHRLYNYVKSKKQRDRENLQNAHVGGKSTSVTVGSKKFRSQDKLSPLKLSKVLDRLQLSYGVPPVLREDLSNDPIFSEFGSIWKNVFTFQYKVLDSTAGRFCLPKSKPKPNKRALS